VLEISRNTVPRTWFRRLYLDTPEKENDPSPWRTKKRQHRGQPPLALRARVVTKRSSLIR
jgi:hypothetical protein